MAPRKAKPDPKSAAAAEGVAAAAGAAAPTPESTTGLMPSHYAPLLHWQSAVLLAGVLTTVPGTESWLYGYMDVQARAPMGFWRCNQHFLHSAPTRVFVVHDKGLIPHDHSCDMLCAYLLPAEAQRVADEPHLKVLG